MVEDGKEWGKWSFKASNLTLEHENSYYIDLEEMRDSANTLDWIFQISAKSWATLEDLGNLIRALDDLLDPQANLCSFGQDKKFDATEYLKRSLV